MKPFMINLYWGGQIVFNAEIGVCYDPLVPKCSTLIRYKLSYRELLDLVYSRVGISKQAFKVNILYRYPDNVRSKLVFCALKLHDDATVAMFFDVVGQLGSFVAEIYIETEPVPSLPNNSYRLAGSPTMFTQYNLTGSLQDEVRRHAFTSVRPGSALNENFVTQNGDRVFEGNESDESDINDSQKWDEDLVITPKSLTPSSETDDSDDYGDSYADPRNRGDVPLPVWSEDDGHVQLGMWFKDKQQLERAISVWSVGQRREYKVIQSDSNAWAAICKIEDESSRWESRINCYWRILAVRVIAHEMWRITEWVEEHSCVRANQSSDHMKWTTMIAYRILHLIKENPSCTVRSVQNYLMEEYGVDISYKNGLTALQKAIKLVNT